MRRAATIAHLTTALLVVAAACGSDDATGNPVPPGTEPPTTQPPITEPPTTEPPTTQPPITEPPITEPPTTQPPTTRPSPVEPIEFELPTDPDAVVLRYDVGVNEPDPLAIAGSVPEFTLYADGRLIITDGLASPGTVTALQQVRLTTEGVRALVERAIGGGALIPRERTADPDEELIADADSEGYEIAVASSNQARDELRGFGSQARAVKAILSGWASSVGDEVVEPLAPLEPASILVLVDGSGDLPFGVAETGVVREARAGSILCAELTGADAQAALDTAASADSSIDWPFQGSSWRLELRPVLPDEPGCDVVPDR